MIAPQDFRDNLHFRSFKKLRDEQGPFCKLRGRDGTETEASYRVILKQEMTS